jgi:two-component system phosphate regulon sensor histidine kinase PhoR
VVITLRDVTELATAVQLKTDFVANASHELRTPLSSIRAAVETLAEQAKDDPASLDWLIGKIATNVGRLEEMTRDLLDLARLESPEVPVEIVAVSAAELAESLTEVFDAACRERRLTLRFDLDPALRHLRTDPRLLTLILKNLVDNATKFAFEGTTILVAGRALRPDGRIGAVEAGPLLSARFEVTDQGVGIPIEQQARIFERFYQVDTSRAGLKPKRGTGLGLAIVKHAVKALGGNVGVRSVWQQGTTITVELPGCVEPDRPAAAPAA